MTGGACVQYQADFELTRAVALMTKNLALLTAMMADKESAFGALESSGSSNDLISLKGPGMMLRRRRAFHADLDGVWERTNERAKEASHIEEGMAWSMGRYGGELGMFGHHKLAKRLFFLLCKIHQAARHDNGPLVKALTCQGLKFLGKITIDYSGQQIAALLLPYE